MIKVSATMPIGVPTALLLAALNCGCGPRPPAMPPESVRVVQQQSLGPLDGSKLAVTVLEVTYAPGAGSDPHRHTCPVLGHVLEGALRTQVRGGPVEVYRAGQSFYEPSNGVHQVSANASTSEPVRFTATLVCDHGEPTTVPAP